jgi:hypothetical protein
MSGQPSMQSLYASIGDCVDGKLDEAELCTQLEAAATHLDAREQQVVEGLLNSK